MKLGLLKTLAQALVCAGHLSLISSVCAKAMPETTGQNALSVEHVEIHSNWTFDEVLNALEATVKPLDRKLLEAMVRGDMASAEGIAGHSPLFIFSKRDHGAILRAFAPHRKAVQLEIGNPITASKMTRRRIAVSLYVPVRVILYELEDGGCAFAYDLPSSVLKQFDDARVSAVAKELDQELKAALLQAAD